MSRWKPSTGTNGSQRYKFRSVSVLFNSSPQPYLFVSLEVSTSLHPSSFPPFPPSLSFLPPLPGAGGPRQAAAKAPGAGWGGRARVRAGETPPPHAAGSRSPWPSQPPSSRAARCLAPRLGQPRPRCGRGRLCTARDGGGSARRGRRFWGGRSLDRPRRARGQPGSATARAACHCRAQGQARP